MTMENVTIDYEGIRKHYCPACNAEDSVFECEMTDEDIRNCVKDMFDD